LGDNDFLRGHAYCFPIQLISSPLSSKEKINSQEELGFDTKAPVRSVTPNLSGASLKYLAILNVEDLGRTQESASALWMHALAIGYSPAYLKENADGIRQDWPRIPLPKSADALERSAELGRKFASLLDTEANVRGVTSGTITPEMKHIGVVHRVDGKTLHPEKEDLALTAGWGHGGKEGVTMPGKGKIERRD
jgi:hypothetical protein